MDPIAGPLQHFKNQIERRPPQANKPAAVVRKHHEVSGEGAEVERVLRTDALSPVFEQFRKVEHSRYEDCARAIHG